MESRLYHRWMIRRDWDEVLEVERQSFGIHAWRAEDLELFIRHRNAIAKVVECREVVIGWVAYSYFRQHIRIESLGVLQDWRRQGVGRALLEDVAKKISISRTRILARVVDWNLAGHLFFTKCGFDCLGVVPTDYNVGLVDAYEFEWKANKEVGCG